MSALEPGTGARGTSVLATRLRPQPTNGPASVPHSFGPKKARLNSLPQCMVCRSQGFLDG